MMRGKFITIEGLDGAGKSTNIAAALTALEARRIDAVSTREPGGTKFGEQVRDLLLNSADEHIGDMAELLLIFAARAQHIEQVIEPALAQGKWVVCDRFTDATFAYQGAGRGIDSDSIANLEQTVQASLRPDLTLLLDLPIEVGQSRAGQRSLPDRFEQQQSAFKQRVRDCYLSRADNEPTRIKVIDAGQPQQQVEQATIAAINQFIESA